ncbi:MAG: hypothetical protein JRJ84_09435 [Deltaproteobacteria bacterium]|nr:hypothetical protein [Deltaproteobacteria bacterium]
MQIPTRTTWLALTLLLCGCGNETPDQDPLPVDTEDCAGVPGGLATVDNCGTCDDDPDNDCVQDCAGVWGGDSAVDSCGTCDSDPSNDCDPSPAQWTPLPVVGELEPDGLSCAQEDWTQKYMRYRLRLRGDGTAAYPGFLSVGSDAGESLPAGLRMPHERCHGHWALGACDPDDLIDAHGMVKWGDGTIWLAEYIQLLASEWVVFTDMGLDTTQTEWDLHAALMAFNRLDDGGETVLGYPAERNGFYLRDDVPASFIFDATGAYRFPRNGTDPSGNSVTGYECVSSASSCETPHTDDGAFTSQDQTVALVHAMALIDAIIPDSLVIDGMPIRHTAREMVDRMVYNLKEDNWKIMDPAGNVPPAEWGGDAVGMSYPLAEAAKRICGDDFRDFGLLEGYHNVRSRTLGLGAWEALDTGWLLTFGYNRTMGLRSSASSQLWDVTKTTERATYDGKDYFALSYSIIHNEPAPYPFSPWRVEAMLDAAPCEGPCRGYAHCEDAPGWRGNNRNTAPDNRSGNIHYPVGEFNGMDYMLLHNLYYLYRQGDLGRRIEGPVPANCDHFRSLDDLRNNGVPGDTYNPIDVCVALDADKRFCGRTFGDWLTATEAGEATIVTGGYRWECVGNGDCTITLTSGGATYADSLDELFLGTDGDDVLDGGDGNDCIYGFAGDDVIAGERGYDELHGGPGDDELYGETSAFLEFGEGDALYGDEGHDLLMGGPARDGLYGGEGNDYLDGGAMSDVMEGGPGDDELRGDIGDDFLAGDQGDDLMLGGLGDDALMGGEGNDRIKGQGGADRILGEEGADFILGGDGDDSIAAGDGDGVIDRSCGGDGSDVIWGGWEGDECRGHDEDGNIDSDGDEVHCSHDDITREQCSDAAFDAWAP